VVYCKAAEPELVILHGAELGAQIKNQKKPELSLKFRTAVGAMAMLEVALASFCRYYGFAK